MYDAKDQKRLRYPYPFGNLALEIMKAEQGVIPCPACACLLLFIPDKL
jgi:hypothetical protein